ncbi:MAG: sugar phosphate isomerase/epimerase [Chloroflexota bacterium]
MKISLSVRVAEAFSNKRVMDIALPELAHMAAASGFDALCMRASAVGIHSTPEAVAVVRQQMDELGLAVSMVTGDFSVPENSEAGPNCLRNITPFLDLAEVLGSDLIRTCIKHEDNLPFAQRAADEAQERGIRLAHQSHTLSLFETVDGSLDVLNRINRPNFGLIYEPANLAICGQDYGVETLQRFAPYLFNVYVQNHVPDPQGAMPMNTWTRGEVMTTLRPLDAQDGIDFALMVEGLRAIGYRGYITSHQALVAGAEPHDAIGRYARWLRDLIQ